ncbi:MULTISPECIES: PTS lactose/cellobiose transporter subunit IIA [Clostridium]|uniref:PTS system cellobiose-specific IIA component n=1 Tax=Clostridium beijerinckii TaxID=1520 RepID=A0A9Q5CP29_CLOBE|nr:PTS lactose/cellobiose transporter subunit IIA [Clostridium beijerinckii]ALB44323.1 PTS lactose/cellobiose transporter subunit IIA [Clostridium beijerinckii NRRL B-598]AQS07393.1 lichenan-specific phosphotransferase enzyme IIA component [Clostridium beijerinckii]MBA2884545.1 PTS system cellobiose-specific IIA component [Clostridium beijerinckii]MBA2898085.1 PTS system cellobiose-specific IIA component [Clostridium beijerinckii]MBA2909936.1 PTS system cellobiose-specific IIA component [Clost
MEETIMNLIVHSGEVRSYSMEAIQCAKSGNMDGARKLIEQAEAELLKAHNVQTYLIQKEARGEKTEVSLLMIHAQDHFMTSMTLKSMAVEIIEIHEKFNNNIC